MNKDYVYESNLDGGKTVYRREMGTTKKELIDLMNGLLTQQNMRI